MALLPWTAPDLGQGIDPARAPFFIPNTVDPRLIALITEDRQRQQQQIGQSIQGALQGLGHLVEQRQQDAIASQLLAGSAPQATAVSQPSAQTPTAASLDPAYASGGIYGDFTPSGQPIAPATPPAALTPAFRPVGAPSTVLSPTEAAQNAALGFPSTQLMRPAQIYAAREFEKDQNLAEAYKKAQIAHLLGIGRNGYNQAPVVDQATGMVWNGRQWVRGPSSGPGGVAERFQIRQSEQILKNQLSDLNRMGGLTKPDGTRITQATFDDPSQTHEGTGPQNEYIPPGYIGVGGNKLETIVPKSQYDSALSAYHDFQRLQFQSKGAGAPASGGATLGSGDIQSRALAIKNDPTMTRQQKIQALQQLGFQ